MLNFKCTNCQNDIQSEYQYIGELVQCPLCESIQIVPDPMLTSGSHYHGYQIGKILASSMLWTTYKAVGISELPEQDVVIRIPSTFFLKRVSDFEEFVDTVIKTGSLNMPGIPTLLDRCTVPGKVYFVFGYIEEAYNLSYFARDKLLAPGRALMITRKIALSLQKAWEKENIIHQNLIPKNLRVLNNWDVRITNIGLSQFLLKDQALLQHGFNIWDYRYMSPEFLSEGTAANPSCDIYSLGGILFLLCTGHNPHQYTDPADLSEAPIPNPTEHQPELPDEIVSLIQLMLAPDPNLRLNTWDEVISRMDKIMTAQKSIKAADFIQQYNLSALQTGKYEATGHQAGGFRKKVFRKKKTETGKTPKQPQKKMTDTVARLAPEELALQTIHRKWRKSAKKGSSRSPSKEAQNLVGLIAFAIIVLVFGSIIFAAFAAHKNKKNKPIVDTRKPLTVKQPKVTVNRADPDRKTVKSPARIKPLKPKKTPARRPKTGLAAKIAAVDKSYLDHPGENKEIINRYEALIPEAVNINRFDLVDVLREKVTAIKKSRAKDVNSVMAKLNKEIKPLVEAGNYDVAIKVVREYNGNLAVESRIPRTRLALQLGKDAGQEKVAQEQAVTSFQEYLEKIAPLLSAGRITEAEVKLELACTLPENKTIKDSLEITLQEIKNYDKLQAALAKAETADEVITANPELTEEAFLLQGLMYSSKGQFPKALASYRQMPDQTGNYFIGKLRENEAEIVLSGILQTYGFEFTAADPEKLLLQLTKKNISREEAGKLQDALGTYLRRYQKTKFLNQYANVTDALTTYCQRITGKTTAATRRIVVDANSHGQLVTILEEAKTGSVIELHNGNYKVTRVRIQQSDLEIIGKGEVIIDGPLEIEGRDIKLSGIKHVQGTFTIASTARKVSISNCSFEDEEIQVIGSPEEISFKNCLFRGVQLAKGEKIIFQHCTFLSPKRGIEAALRLGSAEVSIETYRQYHLRGQIRDHRPESRTQPQP